LYMLASLQLDPPPAMATALDARARALAEASDTLPTLTSRAARSAGAGVGRSGGSANESVATRWQRSNGDDVATMLWACAVLEREPWTSSPLVPTLVAHADAASPSSFGRAATTQLFQSVHRFGQLDCFPGSGGAGRVSSESDAHQHRREYVERVFVVRICLFVCLHACLLACVEG
jgi:hypothetical protein